MEAGVITPDEKECFLFAPASTAGCVRRFLLDDRKFSHTDRREKIEQACAAVNSRILLFTMVMDSSDSHLC